MSYADTVEIVVSEHAYWRAAERFPGFDTATIEEEVRRALRTGRVVTDRTRVGLHWGSDPTCLYLEGEGGRVYATRVDATNSDRVAVITVMRAKEEA